MSRPSLPKKDEGPKVPISVRIPQRLVERIDSIAETTGNDRAEVIISFLRWACAEWETEGAGETKDGRMDGRGQDRIERRAGQRRRAPADRDEPAEPDEPNQPQPQARRTADRSGKSRRS